MKQPSHETEALLKRITSDPEICHGKPVVRGLRYPVEMILEWLSAGMTHAEILADYDDLEEEDILAALKFQQMQEGAITQAVQLELDPIDWQQLELLGRVSPAQRLLTMMAASEFVLAGLRGAFRRRYPKLSQSELNMRVLAYVTPLRGIEIR